MGAGSCCWGLGAKMLGQQMGHEVARLKRSLVFWGTSPGWGHLLGLPENRSTAGQLKPQKIFSQFWRPSLEERVLRPHLLSPLLGLWTVRSLLYLHTDGQGGKPQAEGSRVRRSWATWKRPCWSQYFRSSQPGVPDNCQWWREVQDRGLRKGSRH